MYSKLPRQIDLPISVDLGEGADLSILDQARIIAGPSHLGERLLWRHKMSVWRTHAKEKVSYHDESYSNENFKHRALYTTSLIWLWDEILFDFESQRFTPEKLIAHAQKFGGFDGIILWHAYPVIGVDSRNQFDFYLQVPHLSQLIEDLQEAGMQVYLNYNPWDRWTRRSSQPDQKKIAQIISTLGFDGVFLDTMKSAEEDFMAPILGIKPDVIVGGEGNVALSRICDHVMSWAQWFADSEIPGVLRARWFESRHFMHQTRRWNSSHYEEMQIAWLNASGMLIWENVFGSWVGWSEYEADLWRSLSEFLREHDQVLRHGDWQPLSVLASTAEEAKLYASEFSEGSQSVHLIINKSDKDYSGELLPNLLGHVPAWGHAAIINGSLVKAFGNKKLDRNFPKRVPANISLNGPQGQQESLSYTYRNRECGLYGQSPFSNAWKPLPPDFHQLIRESGHFSSQEFTIDEFEVTNKDFLRFIVSSEYMPRSTHRFLNHWVDGKPLIEDLEKPVTYVDIEDARAFALWRGGHVSTEWQWQIGAERGDARRLSPHVWNLTGNTYSDGRTRFHILKGGCDYSVQGRDDKPATSSIAESDWYIFGGLQSNDYIEKLLAMGLGMSRSENISFRCSYFKGDK